MNSSNAKIIGKNIKELRLKQKLTQKQLSEKIPMNTNYLAVYERGEHLIPSDRLAQIAKALKVDISELTRGVK